MTNAVTVGGEYRYTHYSEMDFNPGTTPAGFIPSTAPGPNTFILDTHQVTARLNYFFGRS